MKLALFDFDGTITSENIFLTFTRYATSGYCFWSGMLKLSPIILMHYMKIISDTQIKACFVKHYFAGMPEAEHNRLIKSFNLECLPDLIRAKAKEKIYQHISQGDRVIVVTACIDSWIRVWCENHDVELIATKLEFSGGVITGKLLTRNCSGLEKVQRLKKYIDLSQYSYIYAYGDSRGDHEMFALANESFYRTFT